MKAIEQYFHAVLFNILYEVVLMLMSVNELKYVQQHFILPLLIKLELMVWIFVDTSPKFYMYLYRTKN